MYWFRAAQSSLALLGSLTVATASSMTKPEECSLFWTRAKIRLMLGLCCATNARISTGSPEDSMKLPPWAERHTADPKQASPLQLSLKCMVQCWGSLVIRVLPQIPWHEVVCLKQSVNASHAARRSHPPVFYPSTTTRNESVRRPLQQQRRSRTRHGFMSAGWHLSSGLQSASVGPRLDGRSLLFVSADFRGEELTPTN